MLKIPDMATPKPSILTWVLIGLMAMSFIVLAKYAVALVPVPGVSDFVNAA